MAVLRKYGRPRAVCCQYGHDLSSCIGGHCRSGKETRRGASAERRRPAGNGRIGSNVATDSCLRRIARTRRLVIMIMERVVRKCAIHVAMSVAFLMAGFGNNDQRRNAHNGKLAEHI